MDPITIAALIAVILAGLFVVIKLVLITATWIKKKIKERLQNKHDVILVDEVKLQEILGEALGETSTVSLDELDLMMASIDENGDVKDIEFISSEEGMDESTQNFIRNHGDMILLTNNA